jgi:hypothetical protein
MAVLHVPDNAPELVAQTTIPPDTALGNTVTVALIQIGKVVTLAVAAAAADTMTLPDSEVEPISMEKVSLPGLVLVVSDPHASIVYVVPTAKVPVGTA